MKKFLIVIAASVLVAAVMIVYAFYFIPEPNVHLFHTTAAKITNLSQIVSANGTVAAATEDNLAFQKSGTLATVNVNVGDHVSRGEVLATLDSSSDQAAVASAQATLEELSRNLTPQELAVQHADLETAQNNALLAVTNAYNEVQSTVVNDANTLFTNPQSADPVLLIQTQTEGQAQEIESEQVKISIMLGTWNNQITAATTTGAQALLATSQQYLSTITTFSDNLSAAAKALAQVNAPSPTNAATYLATTNTISTNIAAAVSDITSAQTALATAQSNYNLKLAGNTSQTIAAQAAQVQEAEASLAEDTLTAPVNGIITESDDNVGETVTANTPFIHLISDTPYQMNVYLPENSIGLVALNQDATVTLDAYGPSVAFPATVVTIDPGQTIVNGVGMYKVTLQFTALDPRIKDGMTGNAAIVVAQKNNVLAVPKSAIFNNDGAPLVLVESNSSKLQTQPVTVGVTGAYGWTEIDSGLTPGEQVVTFGNN